MQKSAVPHKHKMQSYSRYVLELEHLLNKDPSENCEAIKKSLDGQAYGALRSLVPLQILRLSGAFFTGHEIADLLADRAKDEIRKGTPFFDPACGAGNLLLAAAKHLPLGSSLASTLAAWGEIIHGFDLHPEFIEATKLRLILLARQRGNFADCSVATSDVFPNIRCVNALSALTIFPVTPICLLNPPYNCLSAPNDCQWGSGKVSAAAVFIEHVVRNSPPGGRIYALLPEVLRCGSRYKTFRDCIGKKIKVIFEQSLGVFDKWTDIDVFATEIHVLEDACTDKKLPAPPVLHKSAETIEDRYHVHVGPLIDYRSPKAGPSRPYVEAVQATPWAKNFTCTASRKFSGTVFQPPFVVIRRTSRPGDKFRAIGTIVRGNKPVAVENHLLVVLPKHGTVKACVELLHVLRQQKTNDFLNAVMRCRHLTVGSVKNIPWSKS